jgi:hypothetical protein
MFFKTIFSVMILGAATVSLASPSNFINQFKKKGYDLKAKYSHFQKDMGSQCANFAGQWKGQCVDQEGLAEDSELTIEQDGCYSFGDGSFSFPIGGTLSLSSTPQPYAENQFPFSAAVSYQWNDSQTRLNSLSSAIIFNGMGFLHTSQMWLHGDQLRIRDTANKSLMIDNSDPWTMVMEDCSYTKAP